MATNTTCDKCGKAIRAILKEKVVTLGVSSEYDLCDECFKRIEAWLKSKEKKEDSFSMFGA